MEAHPTLQVAVIARIYAFYYPLPVLVVTIILLVNNHKGPSRSFMAQAAWPFGNPASSSCRISPGSLLKFYPLDNPSRLVESIKCSRFLVDSHPHFFSLFIPTQVGSWLRDLSPTPFSSHSSFRRFPPLQTICLTSAAPSSTFLCHSLSSLPVIV